MDCFLKTTALPEPMKKFNLTLILFLLYAVCMDGCAPREKTPLVVFAAGSLIQPFDDLEKAFEAQHPEIDVRNEYHGSIQVIRHATELHEPIDIVASADHALIPQLMFQTLNPATGRPYASASIRFATNKLGVAYTEKSKYAAEITPQNWLEVLSRPDVRIGLADPRFDAAGYRFLMVLKLAELEASQPTLFFDFLDGQFRYPITARKDGELNILHVPEILENKPGARILLRGSSVMLISLLQSGEIDYALEYESVIQQHGFQMVSLPPELNLGEPDQAASYGRVEVQLDFRRFASVEPRFRGEQIGYGITIPDSALHRKEAEAFIAFLLGPEGQQIMRQNHHPLLNPPRAVGYETLPASLQTLVQPEAAP